MIRKPGAPYSPSKIALVVTIFAYLFITVIGNFENVICWDVFGYYLYLPFNFIYHDLEIRDESRINNIINTYHNTGTLYQVLKASNGVTIMKYSMGMSVFYAPFFFIAHFIAPFTGYPADGFSIPYQVSLLSGGLFYSFLGVYFLRKVLLRFFNEKVTTITFLLIIFGTNYLIHTATHEQGLMSQNILFTLYAALIYYTIKLHDNPNYKYSLLCGIIIGLMALSRPTEIIAVIIPLLWNVDNFSSLKTKISFIKVNLKAFSLLLLAIFVIGSLQLIYWKIHAGKYIFNSYGGNAGEGFEFAHPYILEVLFSFRKGWFIYTPIMMLVVFGVPFIKLGHIKFSLLIYFFINLFIVCSWSCWWYAGSFSQRSLIPSYAFLAIPFGYQIQSLTSGKKTTLKYLLLSVAFGFAILNLFQSWQFNKGIIDGDRMTRPYYMSVFGQLKTPTVQQEELLLVKRSVLINEVLTPKEMNMLIKGKTTEIKFDTKENKSYTDIFNSKGKYAVLVWAENENSPKISIPFNELTTKYYAWVKATIRLYIRKEDVDVKDAFLVYSTKHKNWDYKYRRKWLKDYDLKPGEWNEISFDYQTPEVRNKKDSIEFYLKNPGPSKIFIDYLKIECFEPKENKSFF